MKLSDYEKVEGKTVDTETGEIVEEDKVIDFREAK